MSIARIWTQVLRHIATTLYQLRYGVSWQNLNLINIGLHIFKSLRRYLSFVCTFWTTYFVLLTVVFSLDVHSWFYLFSIVFFYICMPLIESKLLSFIANSSRNWTFQRFARVAEKERTQRNKIKIWHSLWFEPRSFGISRRRSTNWATMSVGRTWKNPYKLTHLQITPPPSFFRLDFLNDIFLFADSSFFYGCPQLILCI